MATEIGTGWTEAVPLLAKEQSLVVISPWWLRGWEPSAAVALPHLGYQLG